MGKWWIALALTCACERAETGHNARRAELPDETPTTPSMGVVRAPAAAAPRTEGPQLPPVEPPRPAKVPIPRKTAPAPPPAPSSPTAEAPPAPAPSPTATPTPTPPEPPAVPPPAPRRQTPQSLPDGATPAVPDPDNAPPEFPAAARSRGVEGTVILKIVISERGLVQNVDVVKGDEPFASAARQAVARWRYRPASFQGEPIAVFKIVKVPFRLASR